MRNLLSLVFIALFLFTACELKEDPETYGNIPGMGNTEGELQATSFDLPDGIELIGSITGLGDEANVAVSGESNFKSTEGNQSNYPCYGSGGKWVKVVITMRNTSSNWRTVFFPRGLLFKVNNSGYQHAMLLQWVWKSIPPNQDVTFVLNLYCINKGLDGSSNHVNYDICGVSSSPIMLEFLSRIGWRKINYEHFNIVGGDFKSTQVDYEIITENLQEAIWTITNGNGLTQEQIDFIESIEVMEEGTYPKELDDPSVAVPTYFDEYTPAE